MKGCGNHGCIIEEPKGMGTNSICKCDREIARVLRDDKVTQTTEFHLAKIVREVIKELKRREEDGKI